MPRLQKEYNPNVRETLAHFSETLSLSYDYIHAQSEEILKRLTARNAHNKKRIQFNSEKITRLHPAILRELIRLSIEKLLTHTRLLTFAHIQEIENLIESQSHHAVVSLPYTLEVRKKENRIIFERKNSKYNP
ncbi:MAG: TilS substrate-binding domain-containing protein [Candidatus Omnitrophica bacterium]|nr:TilS substrate-binding domain-containing protein [Candidatus Omnitrophota bacterium]